MAQRMNTLIPMETPDGDRTFVNQWDVKSREKDGWKVVGDERKHVARVDAPVEHLAGGDTEKASRSAGKGKAGKKGAAAGGNGDGDPADPETPPA